MIWLYYLNYAILAAFLSLFIVELGMAVSALAYYGKCRERIRHYVMPLWEITGTFAVFYMMSLVATYPNLIPAVAPLYIAPVAAAALLVVIRNLFLACSEIMGEHRMERLAFRVYSVSTIAIGFVLASILGSVVTGSGVGIATGSISILPMLFNGFGVSLFFVMLLLGLFAASALLRDEEGRLLPVAFAVVAPVLMVAMMWAGTVHGMQGIASNLYLVASWAALLAAVVVLYARGSGAAGKLAIPLIFFGIMVFAAVQNQLVFNGSASLASFMTNAAGAEGILLITTLGGIFLVAALLYFMRITFLKRA